MGQLLAGPWHGAEAETNVYDEWAAECERIASGRGPRLRPSRWRSIAEWFQRTADAERNSQGRRGAKSALAESRAAATKAIAEVDALRGELRRKAARDRREERLRDQKRREAAGTSVHELGLSCASMLWRLDLVSAEEIAAKSERELLALGGIGPKRVAEITKALAARALTLKQEST
ncbi:MAG: hypothetical protein M3433_02620 [Actinomycetota bacterium]|nr:hypothetical protein [Actinomycetota bacterium]